MQKYKAYPEINRLSIVAAAIMLAFALTQLVSFPERLFSFLIFGVDFEFLLDFQTVIQILTVILAATGMDWLIHSHPDHGNYQGRWAYIRHWILPVLTTLVIGIALNSFSGGASWWVIFGLGSFFLIAVLIAEYNVVSTDEIQHPLATVGLISLSFGLFLLLAIAVSSANLRLYIRLPILALGLLMVTSRALYLRLGKRLIIWAAIISLVVSEAAVGLHYLPISPIQYGIWLVGLTYGITAVTVAIHEAREKSSLWLEPLGMLIVVVLVSIFWG